MSELDGAMNPDAEAVVRQRHLQAKRRLQAELKDHLQTKLETLDEDHSALEYARQRSELLAEEAKAVLTGACLVAGDFDCVLSGVYGENDIPDANNSHDADLIPMLKQLISMLEAGVPFTLSSELLNVLQGGNTNIIENNYYGNQGGAGGAGTGDGASLKSGGSGGAGVRVDNASLVQRSADHGGQGGIVGTANSGNLDSSTLVDEKKLYGHGGSTTDQEEAKRALQTKQTFEAAKLESNLRSGEMADISNILEDFERRKKGLASDVGRNMRLKLIKAKSEEERQKIVLEYAQNLHKYTDALEKQKQKALEETRRKLVDRYDYLHPWNCMLVAWYHELIAAFSCMYKQLFYCLTLLSFNNL